MTMAAAEAAGAEGAGGAGASRAAGTARGAASRSGRSGRGRASRARDRSTRARGTDLQRGRDIPDRPARTRPRHPLFEGREEEVTLGGGRGGRGGARPRVRLPRRTYHRIVLAEFVACVVLVGASPILTPRTKMSGDREVVDAAVSLAGPLVRLTAVCIVFFVLALMASGEKSGKVAAAFGGLVVVGTALNATDMLTVIGKAFGPAGSASKDTFRETP